MVTKHVNKRPRRDSDSDSGCDHKRPAKRRALASADTRESMRLPIEIMFNVTEYLTSAEHLNAMSRSCRGIGDFAAKKLYRRYGSEAVFWGARNNKVETVAKALQYIELSVFRESNFTPLMVAAKSGSTEVAELLLTNPGVGELLLNNQGLGETLSFAVEYGHKPMVQLLLKHKANIEHQCGWTGGAALHTAARYRDLDIVKILVDNHADVNALDVYGDTSLSLAAGVGSIAIVQLLLRCGADVNLSGGFGYAIPPLVAAARKGHTEIVAFLLDNGADIHATDLLGNSSLVSAVRVGQYPTVSLLLERGSNIEHLGHGRTILHEAADWSTTKHIGEILLEHGAKVDAVTNEGRTPLFCALRSRNWEMARFLLSRGASIDLANPPDSSWLHFYAHSGELEAVEILLNAGADVYAVNEEGLSVFDVATGPDVPELLHGRKRTGDEDFRDLL